MKHEALYEQNCNMIHELCHSSCIPGYYADELQKRNAQCRGGCEHHTCNGSCASYRSCMGKLESLHNELRDMCRKQAGGSCR
jgi:hypothetical protein